MGLLQNALEEAGFSTSSVTVQPMITAGLGVSRAAYVRFPIGNPLGEPGDVEVQRAILVDLLKLIEVIEEPGIVVKLPYRWRRGLPRQRKSN